MEQKMITSKGLYINGQWVKGQGPIMESVNPAYGSLLWNGNSAHIEDIAHACLSAHNALPAWSMMPFEKRAHYTKVFAEIINKNKDHLSLLISQETGKPLWEAKTETQSVIGKIDISIQAYKERTGSKESITPDANACLRFKPQGVVVVLGAFNFPAHLSNGHIIPALLAGNTILYKPSEYTPAVAEFIMECWDKVGLPPGVINCLQGDASVGIDLINRDIQGVYFTGSYATGLRIHQHFAERPEIILALEMGGNNPLVFDSVKNIDAAVYLTILSTLISSGQRCTCARRLMVPNTNEGDAFLDKLMLAYKKVRIGPYDQNPEPFMGPVIGHLQALKHIQEQKKLMDIGGEALLIMEHKAEYTGFLSPGIIDMTAVKNAPDIEIFAPCTQVYRYDTFEEAVKLANQTRFGLAAGLLSDNPAHYEHFYNSVHCGLINWNRPTTGASSSLPFGGVGLSGNHRPSAYYAADYCAYPVASMEQKKLTIPGQLLPGIELD